MRDTPLISVALCTYDGERFLRRQLDSVLAQDHPELEVVAVDDASRDGTPAILEDYAARDPRVRVFRNAVNLGFARSFQEAMGRCRGELVAPCDQDDVWRADKLRLLAAAMGGRAAAYADSELVDEEGRPLGRRVSQRMAMGDIDDPAGLLLENCVSGHALLFRRSILGQALPIPEGVYHDWWLAFVAASSGGIAWCPEPLVEYRQHVRNVTDLARLRRVPRSRRPRGHRLDVYRADELRLRACAAFASRRGDAFPGELHRLWRDASRQFLSPRLALFAFRHRDRLLPFKRERYRRAWKAVRLLGGLRLKRLLDPHGYGAPSRDGGRAASPLRAGE